MPKIHALECGPGDTTETLLYLGKHFYAYKATMYGNGISIDPLDIKFLGQEKS